MKKIKKILIGTHNKGKLRELGYLLPKNIKKLSPTKFKLKSPKETGRSFKANANLKAKYFFLKSGIPSLSDDSGLCIDILNNRPGIHSSRWAKKNGGFKPAMKKIVKLLKGKNTKAKFVCALTFQVSKKKKISVQGEIRGNISSKVLGNKGFGYDSIFIPKGYKKTFGQMSPKRKLFLDHRYIAFKKLKKKTTVL